MRLLPMILNALSGLMERKEMPLHLPGVPMTILKWLESLPVSVLNSKPALWWKQAAMMMASYQTDWC